MVNKECWEDREVRRTLSRMIHMKNGNLLQKKRNKALLTDNWNMLTKRPQYKSSIKYDTDEAWS